MTLLSPKPRPLHRTFIAGVLALSVAITGLNAAPARADAEDIAKILAGVAVLGIIGAAINDRKHDRRDAQREGHHGQPIPQPYPRPLPPQVRRYDLPAQCLTTVRRHGDRQELLGAHCLRHNYSHVRDLPQACYTEVYSRHDTARGYEPRCLRRYGYRLVSR